MAYTYVFSVLGVPSVVLDVQFVDKTDSSITLLWEPPITRGTANQDVLYDIKCSKCPSWSTSAPCNEPCGYSVTFTPSQKHLVFTTVTIQGLQQNTDYLFVIYSKNENSLRINMTNWARFEMKTKTEGRLLLCNMTRRLALDFKLKIYINS